MSSRRCLTCVCPDVSGQVVAPAEAPHADPALEGLLSWEHWMLVGYMTSRLPSPPVWILMCRVNSSLLENRRSHSFTGQAYGRSWTGALEGRLVYYRARTGTRRMGMDACW